MHKALQCKAQCGNCYKDGSQKAFGNLEEGEFTSSWLNWDALGHDTVRRKALAKVMLFKMMRISATINDREDFSDSMCLNVEEGMSTEKIPTLTRTYKIYEGTGL